MRMGTSPHHPVGISSLLSGLWDFCLLIFGCCESNVLHRYLYSSSQENARGALRAGLGLGLRQRLSSPLGW